MNEAIRPAQIVTPGRIILRELEARGWSQQDLAAILDRPEQAISEIVQAKKQITADTARQLARAFGTSADFWLNLEMKYQLHKAQHAEMESAIERRSRLYRLAPINELIKRGWIKPTRDPAELEQEYCRFFQVPTIDHPPQAAFNPRVSDERGPEDQATIAWVKRVEQLAGNQPAPSFSVEAMPDFIRQLTGLAFREEDVARVPELFLAYGIHFVIVPHLPKTYLDGAALWLDRHPVVALSLRYDRIDAFWFTLLHEVAHIYHNHRKSHVDHLYDHDRGDPGEEELRANDQARNWLLPKQAFDDFILQNRPRFSRVNIEKFALEHQRHPGIVIGQLMFQGEIKYSHLRHYLVRVKPLLAEWEDVSNPTPVSPSAA